MSDETPTPGDAADDWRDEDGHWHYADCGACRPSGCCCFCPMPDGHS